jgi:precorrin-6A/cobalt-precorrin-6A reductase
VLGGTGEAVALARALVAAGHEPVSSLAGVTSHPQMPEGEVRFGGFGGAEGLAGYLRDEGFDAIIDATHPFAARISCNAAEAGRSTGLPVCRLERPAWQPSAGDAWTSVRSLTEAVAALPREAHVFLTTGRKSLAQLLTRPDVTGVARMIEPPDAPLPIGWTLLLSRPPYGEGDEEALMRRHRVTHVVSKNAGGEATAAKLAAARRLSLPVLMIERPFKPPVQTHADMTTLLTELERIFCS